MPREEIRGPLAIDIPLDASGVEDFAPDAPVKVALVGRKGVIASQTVDLDREGRGGASFKFEQHPGALRVVVGPADASDDELVDLQTITRDLSLRALAGREVRLAPIVISAYYWHWWRRWCRTFTIRGRVLCADGSPVPGATVCAFDVDWWWWWSSLQQVGCAVTDASGAFSITFRWCCGWWPWRWWYLRHWQLEPSLVEQISPVIARDPKIKLPAPSPRPSLAMFEELAASGDAPTGPGAPEVELAALPALRERLVAKLPASAALEQLRIWPWAPWQPWWDCAPDIIFKVTQSCEGQQRVIVSENFFNARPNIAPVSNVTLIANQQACCIPDPEQPEGNCVVISSVCGDLVNTIGGNPGAPPAPVGYLHPGTVAVFGDRPYAGTASISGLFGSGANIDFYEFVSATVPGGPFSAMPAAAAGGFSRTFWGPPLASPPGTPPGFHSVPFAFTAMGGRLVVESREHFEATNDPASWGTTRFWVQNRDLLMHWHTANVFADDTYYLQLVGYSEAGGQLGEPQVLPLCDTEKPNGLALTIDNSTGDNQPAADIVDVRINGASAGPCSNVNATDGGTLTVDFVAYDEDFHLGYYSLIATYGKNLAVNLLAIPGATLSPLALGAIPAADFVGPNYGAARGQGAPSPRWRAGGLRLTVPDLRDAFPETCCYQLELRVYKRTVVSCNHNYTPAELSYYSLTVVV
jgi:hypothetical protein